MPTSPHPPTAIIYEFPGKAGATEALGRATGAGAASRWLEAAPRSDFMSGWYHEAAIRDAERSRKH